MRKRRYNIQSLQRDFDNLRDSAILFTELGYMHMAGECEEQAQDIELIIEIAKEENNVRSNRPD
jgi:hypothetical protein